MSWYLPGSWSDNSSLLAAIRLSLKKSTPFQRRCDRRIDYDTRLGHYANWTRCNPAFQKYACFDCRKVFKCTSSKEDGPIIKGPWYPPHCPSCGKEGRRVGTAFKAPSRNDLCGWKELREWVESGGEESAQKSLMQERRASRQRLRVDDRSRISMDERRKRIEALQKASELGVRTSEEERKLSIIRTFKGKTTKESWGVVVGL
ncbi:hypothetical protein PHLGIDRAFT_440524 [Phlebiopsis gigantea 11061_1 CR5-6]|uniref:Uncharacterized protein n=1 Tax=Phlebiopsis gigantea (strain 11061_1 CR5-6) TaxID=745531 RepID=A0A0C3SFB3_PHLG1|nr:hypothetical protein PHLGIDRAFT_440524 [Phlebiopsis gigantea 11061_1 CR5-6]